MQWSVFALFFFTLTAVSGPAAALPVPLSLEPCGTAQAARALTGDTLETASGEVLSLSAVKAPELWPTDAPYKSWTYAGAARRALAERTDGAPLTLFCEGTRVSHDGRRLVQVLLPDGHWLQHRLVEAGAVFVYPRGGDASGLDALYAAEALARSEGRGLWQGDSLTARATDDLSSGWFRILQGTVLSARKGRDRVYLNFGSDWRTDFTVEIPTAALRRFRRAGIDPLAYEGAEVEVRGWLDWRGGPRLLLEAPGQVRLIGTNPPRP